MAAGHKTAHASQGADSEDNRPGPRRGSPRDQPNATKHTKPTKPTEHTSRKTQQQTAYRRWKHAHGICVTCTDPVSRTNSWYCERHRQAQIRHAKTFRRTHRDQVRARNRLWRATHQRRKGPTPARRCAWCHRWMARGITRSRKYHPECRTAVNAARSAEYQRTHWEDHLRRAREYERQKHRARSATTRTGAVRRRIE